MNKLILCSLADDEIENGLDTNISRGYIFKISFSIKEMKDDIDILISKVCDENGFEYEIPEESVLIVFLNSHKDLKKFYAHYNSILILQNLEG